MFACSVRWPRIAACLHDVHRNGTVRLFWVHLGRSSSQVHSKSCVYPVEKIRGWSSSRCMAYCVYFRTIGVSTGSVLASGALASSPTNAVLCKRCYSNSVIEIGKWYPLNPRKHEPKQPLQLLRNTGCRTSGNDMYTCGHGGLAGKTGASPIGHYVVRSSHQTNPPSQIWYSAAFYSPRMLLCCVPVAAVVPYTRMLAWPLCLVQDRTSWHGRVVCVQNTPHRRFGFCQIRTNRGHHPTCHAEDSLGPTDAKEFNFCTYIGVARIGVLYPYTNSSQCMR